MNLTQEDRELLETEFHPEIEKEAAEQAAVLSELYSVGFEKMASKAADEMDEEEEEEKEEHEHEEKKASLHPELQKEAAGRGAFLARYYVEGLQKEGSDRHGDPLHYFYPAIAEYLEKVADGPVPGRPETEMSTPSPAKEKTFWEKTKEAPGKAYQRVKDYHHKGDWEAAKKHWGDKKKWDALKAGAKHVGRWGTIPAAAAATGGLAYGGHKAYKHYRNKGEGSEE